MHALSTLKEQCNVYEWVFSAMKEFYDGACAVPVSGEEFSEIVNFIVYYFWTKLWWLEILFDLFDFDIDHFKSDHLWTWRNLVEHIN